MSKSKENDLEAKDFHVLFDKNQPKWVDIEKEAYAFAKQSITKGDEPRDDDIAEAMLPILGAEPELKNHQRKNRATSEKYKKMFAEYVVDRVKLITGGNR